MLYLVHGKGYATVNLEKVCSSRRIRFKTYPLGMDNMQKLMAIIQDAETRPWDILLFPTDDLCKKQMLLAYKKIIAGCKANGTITMVCMAAENDAALHLTASKDLLCLITDRINLSGNAFLDCAINL